MDKTLLVVDDSATILASLEACLKTGGYRVAKATDGNDGLRVLTRLVAEGQAPALIISDVNMPGMDGITFVKEVKKLPALRFTPIVMLTTETQEEKKNEGRSAGASGWLNKPFQPEQLLGIVRKFVR